MHKFWAIAVGCALSVGMGVAQKVVERGEGQQDFVVGTQLNFSEKGSIFHAHDQKPSGIFGEYWMTHDVDASGGKDRLASALDDISASAPRIWIESPGGISIDADNDLEGGYIGTDGAVILMENYGQDPRK